MVAHETAAIVQKHLRRTLFEKLVELGPAYAGAQRSGEVDGARRHDRPVGLGELLCTGERGHGSGY